MQASELLISVLAFLFAIAVLVTVHEWGHFIVARKLGVKVLRFSIGFGKRVCGWTDAVTGTEYWLSAVPFGGYVKMLDEREGPVDTAELQLAFNRQPPWKRILIVIAGPGLNFVFAIAAYWIVFMLGVSGLKPLLAEVPHDSLAYSAGLRGGEAIVRVDSENIVTWNDLRTDLLKSALRGETVQLQAKDTKGVARNISIDLNGVSADPDVLFLKLGMRPFQPHVDPVLGVIESGGAAAKAGLHTGDRVLSVQGTAISDWSAFVDWIRLHPGQTVDITVRRGARDLHVQTHVGRAEEAGGSIGRIGAGVDVKGDLWQDLRAVRKYGPLEALPAAATQTWDLSVLTLKLMGRMATGDVSWKNVSGPIQIAQYAGYTASIGFVSFLSFLAVVSISLGVLNLLPVPVLDGGHLLYYGVEMALGRPLSDRVQMLGQKIGIAMLVALMCLAFYNDITRLFAG